MTTKMVRVCGGLMAACALWVTSTQSADAGGSVAFEDIRHLIPEPVIKHLESTYTIDPVGDATRLGRHYTELGGARVGPYHFRVTAKQNADLVFELTLQTDVAFLNADEKATDDPGAAAYIREQLLSCELVSNLAPTDTATPAPIAMPVTGSAGVMPPPPPLTDEGREQVVEAVRANYRDVEATEMEFDGGAAEADELSCEIIRGYTRQGVVRRVEFFIGAGDHGGYKIEMQCDSRARPSFVLFESSYWSFVPGDQGKTIDSVTQKRFYFSPAGQLAMSLEKEFKGSDEQALQRNGDAAKNHPFPAKPEGVPAFFAALASLPACEDRDLVDIANKLIAAQRVMAGEP